MMTRRERRQRARVRRLELRVAELELLADPPEEFPPLEAEAVGEAYLRVRRETRCRQAVLYVASDLTEHAVAVLGAAGFRALTEVRWEPSWPAGRWEVRPVAL